MKTEELEDALQSRLNQIRGYRDTAVGSATQLYICGFFTSAEFNALADKIDLYYEDMANKSKRMQAEMISKYDNLTKD